MLLSDIRTQDLHHFSSQKRGAKLPFAIDSVINHHSPVLQNMTMSYRRYQGLQFSPESAY